MRSMILAAVVLFGCAEPMPAPDYLESAQPFRAEVRIWGDAERAIELLHMVGFELVQADSPDTAQIAIYDSGPGCDGHKEAYTSDCGGVWLCGPVSDTVLAHEIGHTLGAQHVSELDGSAVMNPRDDLAVRMTQLDADAFKFRKLAGSIFDPACAR